MIRENRLHAHIKFLFILLISLLIGCNKETSTTQTEESIKELNNSTLASLKKVDDYPFYTMTYYGDYGFDKMIKSKTGNSGKLIKSFHNNNAQWGCTCFAAMGDKNTIYFGRNFDWHYCIPMLLFTKPPNGYASVSMVDLEYLGYNVNNLPDDPNNRQGLLRTPFLPFDGVNEKGVAIGIMAIPYAEPPFDSRKKSIQELEVLRLVLDYAENTDKAIELIKQHNVIFTDPPIHYLIADATGNSAVVEFVNNEMVVIKNKEPWLVLTNFIIHGTDAPNNVTCWRYNTAYNSLKSTQGKLIYQTAMNILQQVSQPQTIWSMVYEMKSGNLGIALGRKYQNVLSFKLK